MNDRDGWRVPGEGEAAVLHVLLLADFPASNEAAGQLGALRVRDVHCAGMTSLDLQVSPGAPSLPLGHPSTLVEAEGEDEQGRRLTATVFAANGRLSRLEVKPIGLTPVGQPMPATLRQLDAVPRGTLELLWLVPRPRTILEERGGP